MRIIVTEKIFFSLSNTVLWFRYRLTREMFAKYSTSETIKAFYSVLRCTFHCRTQSRVLTCLVLTNCNRKCDAIICAGTYLFDVFFFFQTVVNDFEDVYYASFYFTARRFYCAVKLRENPNRYTRLYPRNIITMSTFIRRIDVRRVLRFDFRNARRVWKVRGIRLTFHFARDRRIRKKEFSPSTNFKHRT